MRAWDFIGEWDIRQLLLQQGSDPNGSADETDENGGKRKVKLQYLRLQMLEKGSDIMIFLKVRRF
jgi:hypothetical protein